MHNVIFLFHWPVVCLYLATYFLFHWIILCACFASCLIWLNFHRWCPWLLGRGESDCVIVSSWLQGTSLYFPFVFIWADFQVGTMGTLFLVILLAQKYCCRSREDKDDTGWFDVSVPDICAQFSSPFPGWVSRKPSFPLPVIHNQSRANKK